MRRCCRCWKSQRKMMFSALSSTDRGDTQPARVPGEFADGVGGARLICRLASPCPADVDDIVGDHTEADPALHSDEALVTVLRRQLAAEDGR
jgi:hypothetical protein